MVATKAAPKICLPEVKMGMPTKILIIALLLIAAWYGYENVKIGTVTVCVDKEPQDLTVTCVEDSDCAKYLIRLCIVSWWERRARAVWEPVRYGILSSRTCVNQTKCPSYIE